MTEVIPAPFLRKVACGLAVGMLVLFFRPPEARASEGSRLIIAAGRGRPPLKNRFW